MGLYERLKGVVKSEWNARVPPGSMGALWEGEEPAEGTDAALRARRGVRDVQSAYRVLEIAPSASLADVRAAYRSMATRYHPRSHSATADQAHAAQSLLIALTEALEVLEEHLLPLPAREDGPRAG